MPGDLPNIAFKKITIKGDENKPKLQIEIANSCNKSLEFSAGISKNGKRALKLTGGIRKITKWAFNRLGGIRKVTKWAFNL